MATTVDAYKLFRTKISDTASTRNTAINLSKFVILFNKNYLSTIKNFLGKNTEEIDYIQEFFKTNEELLQDSVNPEFTSLKLPSDFLEYDSFFVTASKNGCKDKIEVFPIKYKMKAETMLSDPYYEPSFEYRESLFRITDNKVNIYTKDFEVNEVRLDYYKTPKLIRLEDPRDPESKLVDEKLEGSRYFIDIVVSNTVAEYALSNEDYNKFEGEKINNK